MFSTSASDASPADHPTTPTDSTPDGMHKDAIPAESSPDVAEALVERIHTGEVDPAGLSIDLRRACVENLTDRSLTSAEIAGLLRISPATVRRDRAALRSERAVAPDRLLGDAMLGELLGRAGDAVARLTRLAADDGNPAYCRMWAEEAIVRIGCRCLDQARQMGYIETGERRLRQQRQADPAEAERSRQQMQQAMRLLTGG